VRIRRVVLVELLGVVIESLVLADHRMRKFRAAAAEVSASAAQSP
jgi:hypothetical protein